MNQQTGHPSPTRKQRRAQRRNPPRRYDTYLHQSFSGYRKQVKIVHSMIEAKIRLLFTA